MANPKTGIILNPDGYFEKEGQRIVPVGVNYWPSSCGVEMWRQWKADEIQADLDLVCRLGLNCVRFFLRWQDFEPAPGWYDSTCLSRLSIFLDWCCQRDLLAQPSLFVGWMSGGIFWPPWKENRNFYSDTLMVERAAAFARQTCEIIAPYHANLLGIDLGNEICDLPDCDSAPPGSVIEWCRSITNAIRSVYPQALIVAGNEQRQLNDDCGWRFGNQPGTDYYSMHGYPVPNWHTVGFDGMTDPLAQSLLPTYISAARAFGPVLLQEFGTIATFGIAQQELYLRNLLPACWKAGANGFLWWCLRDIHARVHPYTRHNFESTLGLVDHNDMVKPGLEYFIEFARSTPERDCPDLTNIETGIYFPIHYYHRDNPDNPGQSPREVSSRFMAARYLVQQNGHRVQFVRGDLPFPPSLKCLVVPGIYLTLDDQVAIQSWVYQGGILIWSGVDPVNWGDTAIKLLGAQPVDYRAAVSTRAFVYNEDWEFSIFPRGYRVEVQPTTATVLATDSNQLPLLLKNQYGSGYVVFTIPLIENHFVNLANYPSMRDRWIRFYRGLLSS